MGVTDAVADDLGVNAVVECQRGVGVPDIVQTDTPHPGQVDQPVEAAGDRVGVQGAPVG